ncbi:arginine--tRNA ligase [Candidatus Peregrinibacteria bacterium]|nr:arginine--tRNA ligase [Candidatus Peregrinibacteria bacterium]
MYEHLTKAAKDALSKQFGVVPDVVWEYTQGPDRGDVSTCIALQIAKNVKSSPRAVAEVVEEALKGLKGVERTEIAGSGYVNVWLTPDELLKGLIQTRTACTAKVKRKKEAPIIIDYCGPNIAKPLGIHHILSHVVGQAMINLYRHGGYNVIGWSYPGDWGTQFGKLFVAYEKWGSKKPVIKYSVDELLSLYVRFHQEAEENPSLEDDARKVFAKMEAGDKTLRTFWREVVEISRKDLEKLYARLQIHVDIETGESFYEEKMNPILEEGQKKGVVTRGEGGALIVEFSAEKNLPPMMLKKSDGSTLYATRDLAMVRYRLDEYDPKALYYVVDVAQSLHFQQLEAACELFGWKMPAFEHVYFGRMRFADASMSTRKGTVIRLEDALDEGVRRAAEIIRERGEGIQTDAPEVLAEMMGIGALVYGILSQNRKMDIIFDWNKMLSFEGNSAPYLQYTHARSRSVLRKANQKNIVNFPTVDRLSASERKLIGTLLQFALILDEACVTHMPHKLAHYLYALCQDYNAFYNAEPILQAAEPSRTLRLSLTACAADVLKTGAELLTLRVPDRM